jgi:hypothetical protein
LRLRASGVAASWERADPRLGEGVRATWSDRFDELDLVLEELRHEEEDDGSDE